MVNGEAIASSPTTHPAQGHCTPRTQQVLHTPEAQHAVGNTGGLCGRALGYGNVMTQREALRVTGSWLSQRLLSLHCTQPCSVEEATDTSEWNLLTLS